MRPLCAVKNAVPARIRGYPGFRAGDLRRTSVSVLFDASWWFRSRDPPATGIDTRGLKRDPGSRLTIPLVPD